MLRSRPTGLSPRVRVGDAELEKLWKHYATNASELALFCIVAPGSQQEPRDDPKGEGIKNGICARKPARACAIANLGGRLTRGWGGDGQERT